MKGKNKKVQEDDEEEEIRNQPQENVVEFHPIDLLQEGGINAGDIKKLVEAGFNSLEAISYTCKKNLVIIKGLSEMKVDKIIKVVEDMLKYQIQPSTIALEERKKLVRITSGSKELDNLLGGGFKSNFIAELFGEFHKDKTQIYYTLYIKII